MATATVTRKGGSKLMALWKQGWNEIPEVMGSAGYGLLGNVLLLGGLWYGLKTDKWNHRYKTSFIVYRPGDERLARVKRFEDSPQPTSTPAALLNSKSSIC